MKLTQLFALLAIMYSSVSLNAQSAVLQTISTDAKNSASKKVVESADRTVNKTLDKLLDGNLFKKKAAKTDNAAPTAESANGNNNTAGKTELTIAIIDYSSIVALSGVIKSNKNVSDVQRSFTNGSGVISVTHSCKTEELLDDILNNTNDKYEVVELTNGKIILKLKVKPATAP